MGMKAGRQAGKQAGRQARQAEEMKREKGRYNIACNTSERILFAAWKVLSLHGRGKTAPGHGDVRRVTTWKVVTKIISIQVCQFTRLPVLLVRFLAAFATNLEKRTFYIRKSVPAPLPLALSSQILMVTLDARNNEDTKCSIQRWQLLDYTTHTVLAYIIDHFIDSSIWNMRYIWREINSLINACSYIIFTVWRRQYFHRDRKYFYKIFLTLCQPGISVTNVTRIMTITRCLINFEK